MRAFILSTARSTLRRILARVQRWQARRASVADARAYAAKWRAGR